MSAQGQNSFAISGSMLVGTARAVNQQGLAAIARGVDEIDLAEVAEVDSAGIAVLLAWLREAKKQNRSLSLKNIPQSLRSLAAVYDVSELIPE